MIKEGLTGSDLTYLFDVIRADTMPEGTFGAYDIGELNQADLSAYTALMRRVIAEAEFLDDEAKLEILKLKTEEYYQERLQQKDKWSLLAAKNDTNVIGVLEASIEENPQTQYGFIRWVCIDPLNRGQRVAPALYCRYEDLLRRRNISLMVAAVADNNEPSLRMHEKVGFNMQVPIASQGEKKWYGKEVQMNR